ncbi:Leucine aminopeptidase 2, chloroplastic [Triticum urartu]|uniref:Leucine aminopeptidase 2, chloroplastic n=1 Tax=Triticum urartu TaxID=4572 RepID=M7YXL0_TRIUA|nr:Leucine aminopeptidase 2, chloroplastic [Triticum urartu]
MAHTAAAVAALGLTKPNVVEPLQVSFAAIGIEPSDWEGDVLAVAVTEKDVCRSPGSSFENAVLKRLDSQLGGLLSEASAEEDFAGKAGTVLGLYEDNRYRSESNKVHLKQVDLIGLGYGPEMDHRLELAKHVSSGVIFGKDLVNSPANVLTPVVLAEEASKIASMYSDVFTATILNEERCRELKMGSYLAVAAASANPPRFIHLCYKPSGGNVKRKLAIVGKGVTFDSGGYNIKIGAVCNIELMKWDMGGSAAVFGAAKALGQIKPPGVEVDNTDAEGRLTLADALVYACKQGVDKIIDLATLTGFCRVALGPSIAGILTPSDELHEEVAAASEVSGEKFWRLPLEESYWETMKSGVADMLNTGAIPQGGVITAALFLKQFVDEKVQWMHMDIAGPVWSHKNRSATGFGVSTMVEWVLKNSS